MDVDSAHTLREGLRRFSAANAAVAPARDMSPEAREFFRCHDTAHAVFGCDTSISGEGVLKIFTICGTTLGFRKHLAGYAEADAFALSRQYSWSHVARHIFKLIAKSPRAFIHARRMSKPWPWAEHGEYLDRSLEEIRREFKIKVVRTSALLLVPVLGLALAGGTAAGDLDLVRTIGLAENGPIHFINPYDLDWDASGQAYVLSGGDSRIVAFSRDWQHLRTFAGEGEAPGELNRPMGLSVVGTQIWVKVPRGAEVFETSGDYAGLVRMGHEIGSLAYSNGKLYGTATSGAGVGVELGRDGKAKSAFGPTPSQPRTLADFFRVQSWLAVPAPDGSCTLLDTFDGRAWAGYGDSVTGSGIDLGLGRGEDSGDGNFKKVVLDACVDPAGGYFVTHFDRSSQKRELVHYDKTWQANGRWEIPPEIVVSVVRVSPRSELCLLSESASILYVFERPVVED